MIKRPRLYFLPFFFLLGGLITSCSSPKEEVKFKRYDISGQTQGTTYNIIYVDTLDKTKLVQQKVDSVLNAIDLSVSTYNKNSVLSKFNKSDSCFLIDDHILTLFLKSDEINAITDGAFDPTVKPIVNLWGFGAEPLNTDSLKALIPDSLNKDSVIAYYRDSMSYDLTDFVGFEYVILNGDIVYNTFDEMLTGEFTDNFLCKDDSIVQLTFDAIAQGYSADEVADFLALRLGINNFLVEIGGEIVTQGYRVDEQPWLVQIEHPNTALENGQDELARVRMDTNFRAIAVSGNYRKFRKENGKTIVHSIDPRTGRPAKNIILSATVLANDAATADAFATAFMVMRLEEIIPIVEANNIHNIYTLIVYENEQGELETYVSTNLEDKLLYPREQVK